MPAGDVPLDHHDLGANDDLRPNDDHDDFRPNDDDDDLRPNDDDDDLRPNDDNDDLRPNDDNDFDDDARPPSIAGGKVSALIPLA